MLAKSSLCEFVSICVYVACFHAFYLIAGPSIRKGWPESLDADHLSHVFIWRVCRNQLMVRQLVLFKNPYNKCSCVKIYPAKPSKKSMFLSVWLLEARKEIQWKQIYLLKHSGEQSPRESARSCTCRPLCTTGNDFCSESRPEPLEACSALYRLSCWEGCLPHWCRCRGRI